MKKQKEHATDEIIIRSLSDAQAVRTRPGMYVGGVENPDLIFREVIDGSFDESYATGCDSILISTNFNNYYFVADNGRGIPCTMSLDDPTKTQAFLAMSKLHAGSKFETTGVRAGMHGCGESAANFLSSQFVLFSKITADNFDKSIPAVANLWNSCGPRSKKDLFYVIAFTEGNLVYEGALRKSDAEEFFFKKEFPKGYMELPSGYSTMVMFRPDPTIFVSTKASLPIQNIQNFLLIQEKFYGRKIKVNIDGTEMTSSTFKPYKFEFIKTIIPADTTLNDQVSVYVTFELDQTLSGKTENGSVNGLTVNQGIHITWLETLFDEALKSEYGIKHRFTCNGLKMYVILLAGEVLYDSQTKTRLKSISKVKISDLSEIKKEFIKVFKKNSEEVNAYVEKLNFLADSMKTLSASEKAQKMMDNASGTGYYKSKSGLVEGFSDATLRNRWDCELYLCEGLSPCGALKAGRRPYNGLGLKEAILPLRGKILNVSEVDINKALDNKEISTIFTILGVGIQENNVTSGCKTYEEAYQALQANARYGKICIACDADSDGSQICSLILYLFSKYARFLIDLGCVYVSLSPLFEQDGKYWYPGDQLDATTGLPVGLNPAKSFRRWKGLGSIPKELIYDSFFNPATRRLIQVTPDGIDYAMSLIDDINVRKNLLVEAGILTNPYNL